MLGTGAALLDRLARTLAAPAPAGTLPGDDVNAPAAAGTPAAVLVPVVTRPEPTLLLTVRTAALRHHAGQIAFPGGRMEPGEDACAAALREAHDEIGLDPSRVRVAGIADPYVTVTGFTVVPVIALVPPDLPLAPHEGEVAEIFEAPLRFVTDPANHLLREMDWLGATRTYYEINWGTKRIWGATAAMIVNLSRRLAAVA